MFERLSALAKILCECESMYHSRLRQVNKCAPSWSLALRVTMVYCRVMVEQSLRWDAGRSTRHNQDAQRERESRVLRDLTAWLTLAAPNTHDAAHGNQRGHRGRPDRRKECTSGPDPGIYYRLEAEFRERHGGHSHGHGGGGGGTFRAKVQAISRIKLRLRHRAAFSASR